MRILLALVAALGLPLCALAQTPGDDGKPTEVSALVIQAQKATEVPGVTVTGRCPIPPNSNWANTMFDAPSESKNKRTEEGAGTREFILREIADIRNNTRDYTHMSIGLARAAREQLPQTKLLIVCHGVFKGVKFLHVSQEGFDDFEVEFSNGALEWEVAPVDAHQVTPQSAIRYFFPQPATKQFEDFLNSMQRGRPNYADLTPDLSATVQAQWPALQKSLKDWGGLESVYFLRQADDGSYIYLVSFGRRRVVWEVAPLDGGGKLVGLKYAEAPG